jgi:hypothetical protein
MPNSVADKISWGGVIEKLAEEADDTMKIYIVRKGLPARLLLLSKYCGNSLKAMYSCK